MSLFFCFLRELKGTVSLTFGLFFTAFYTGGRMKEKQQHPLIREGVDLIGGVLVVVLGTLFLIMWASGGLVMTYWDKFTEKNKRRKQ